MSIIKEFAQQVKGGRSLAAICASLHIQPDSASRYLRWAKEHSKLPKDVIIRDGQFWRHNDLYGANACKQHGITAYVVFGDTHCPYQDNRAINVMCQIIVDLQPDYVIENGDGIDCYLFSRFSKDPNRAKTFQQERDSHKKNVVDKIKEASSAEYLYLGGDEDNHYVRWVKEVVWANRLHDMPELTPSRILYLEDDEYEEGPKFIGTTFRISHGIRYGENAPKLDLRDYMMSGLQNHNHRLGTYYRTTATQTWVYATNGHLSDPRKTYKKHPNWQSGFSVLYMFPDGRFRLEQLPIVKHKTIFQGKLYRA